MVRTGYEVRPYTSADEPAVLRLLEASLQGGPTGRRTAAFFRWKHEANPFGESLRLVAEHEGQVIGFRSFLRWRFLTGGRVVSAVRAVDTATHPDHQGRGVFTRLTMAGVEALRDDTDLIFNTPNNRSGPGYLKMGWSPVGSVPLRVRPARPWRVLRGAPAAVRDRGSPGGPPPPCRLPPAANVLTDEDTLVDLLAPQDSRRLTTDRSVAYLRWRYAHAPDLDYRALTVHEGGHVTGLAIGRPRRRGPLAEFLLAEALVRPGDARSARRLLAAVAAAGCDHVVAHAAPGTVVARAARTAAYLPAPWLGIGLVARPLSPAGEQRPELDSWQLSLGDLELF